MWRSHARALVLDAQARYRGEATPRTTEAQPEAAAASAPALLSGATMFGVSEALRCVPAILARAARDGTTGIAPHTDRLVASLQRDLGWTEANATFGRAFDDAFHSFVYSILTCIVRVGGGSAWGLATTAIPMSFLSFGGLDMLIRSISSIPLGTALDGVAALVQQFPPIRRRVLTSTLVLANEMDRATRTARKSLSADDLQQFMDAHERRRVMLARVLDNILAGFGTGPRSAAQREAVVRVDELLGRERKPVTYHAIDVAVEEGDLARVVEKTTADIDAQELRTLLDFLSAPEPLEAVRASPVRARGARLAYDVVLRRVDPINPNELEYVVQRAAKPVGEPLYMDTRVVGELSSVRDMWNNVIRGCCTYTSFYRFDEYLE